MISNLVVKNFILIDDLDVSFDKGLNVLIGETGAGKSILVSALLLLTGIRSNFDRLQDESKKAIIEASFILSDSFIKDHPELIPYLADNNLTISRSLSPTKVSQFRVNGELISLSEARTFTRAIVDILSQGGESELVDPSYQLKLLDRSIKGKDFPQLIEEYQVAFKEFKGALAAKEEFVKRSKEKDLDFIRYRLEEIEKADIKEGEIEEIKEELANAEKMESLIEGGERLSSLYSSNEFSEIAREITHGLAGLASGRFKTKSEELMTKWEDFYEELSDLVGEYDSLEIDTGRIDVLNDRLFSLKDLMKKYGEKTSDILDAKKDYETKILEVESYELFLKEHDSKIELSKEKCLLLANKIHEERLKAAKDLTALVCTEFKDLALKEDGFKIDVSSEDELGEKGNSRVEFMVGLNKGHPYETIKKAASGGETSRLMLALKKALNSLMPVDTLILDEVDTGVSGDVAIKVGRKIKELSKTSTIIAISHLPPVAAGADKLYMVYKEDKDTRTNSYIKPLDEKESIVELAKMLGGNASDEAMKLAQNLRNQQK